MKFFILSLLVITLFGCTAGPNVVIRAGLDYEIEVFQGDESKIITLDFGSHFVDDKIYFQTMAVSKENGYVELVFKESTAKNKDNVLQGDNGFGVDFNQIFRIYKNQTVHLDNTDIKVKLIDVTGEGCPPGAQC